MKAAAAGFPEDDPRTVGTMLLRLRRLEKLLRLLIKREIPPEHYSVEEFARKAKRRPYTIRYACNKGRLNAVKTTNGRHWVLTHAELLRFRKEGLLPHRDP